LNFVKCDDSDQGTTSQKFFQEPAYVDTLFWARQWLNVYAWERNRFMYTNVKFRILLDKLSNINKFENSQLPVDVKVDKTLILEICKKGPCLKKKEKGKLYLPELYKVTYNLSSRFKMETNSKK